MQRLASPPPLAATLPPNQRRRAPRTRNDRPVIAVLIALDVIFALALLMVGGRPGMQTFATVFLGIFIEAMPFVLVGALVSGVIGVFVRDETVARLLPRGRLTAPVVGSLLGLIFPVCECGVVPVTRRLVNKGAQVGLGVAFLFASPVINPIVLWSTYSAFGGNWQMVAWRAGLTFAIAAFVGFVFTWHPNGRALLKSAPAALGYHRRCRMMRMRMRIIMGIRRTLMRRTTDAEHDHTQMPLAEKLRACLRTQRDGVLRDGQVPRLRRDPRRALAIAHPASGAPLHRAIARRQRHRDGPPRGRPVRLLDGRRLPRPHLRGHLHDGGDPRLPRLRADGGHQIAR